MPRRPPRNIFVDLLPASWSGQPPGLPPEVIADLARRAREADRLERKERQAVAQQRATAAPVRVHVATQPTFTRYIFAVPAKTSVSADRTKERLTLTFDAPIKFDLADVVAALPRAIGGIDTEMRDDSALVRVRFLAKVDIRTFRDDGSYVLDIVGADNKPDEASAAPAAPATPQQSAAPETTAPATVPPAAANDAAAPSAERSARSDGKTRRRATGNNRRAGTTAAAGRQRPAESDAAAPAAGASRCGAAVAAPSPADKPAAAPKVEAQIAAPATHRRRRLQPIRQKRSLPRCRQLRRHRNATRPPCLTNRPTTRRRRARAPPIAAARSRSNSPARAPT